MIQIKALNKSYLDGQRTIQVLNNLDLTIQPKTSIAITGESGAGKSTLLHLLAALDTSDSGEILVNNQNILSYSQAQADAYRKRQVGIVFQRFNLIDCLNVWDNVCFPARINNNLDHAFVTELLAQLGIEKLKAQLPANLSGGEQQRVAIARALAHKPALVIADEPTGNLDEKNSKAVSKLLFSVCAQHEATLVLVTHSHDIAHMAQQHLQLSNGKFSV